MTTPQSPDDTAAAGVPPGGRPPEDGVKAAFNLGELRGRQPGSSGVDGPAPTGRESPWVRTWRPPGATRRHPCLVCGHTFRRGDQVYLRYDAEHRLVEVTHHMPHLPCSGLVQQATQTDAQAAADFFRGVDLGDPLPDEVHVTRLMPDDPVLSGPEHARCFVCAHSLRPFESVVICPCDPADPGCRTSAHQDPARGLTCFEDWQPGLEVTRCPMNFQLRKRG
ncbi:hypothetical protein ACFVHB_00355 [Kitasatospora sp. NPDC127111]|uniref:hypothetical protein n=1 Tax=Kitasatospora sp. NPDC127111 TaxID=3345363 RepID=UPI0036365001